MSDVFVTITELPAHKLKEHISGMDKATGEWTAQAARGECGWICSDCCMSDPKGMPDECFHVNPRCTEIIQRDKREAMREGSETIMTNKTINDLPRELLRHQFEEKNEHRGWFVAGGRLEGTSPEGYIYEDFTTDMCWTCYFEAASSALLATPDPIVEADGIGEPAAWRVTGRGNVTITPQYPDWAIGEGAEGLRVSALYPLSPASAAGVEFGFESRSVTVSQEAYSIFIAREAALQSTIAQLRINLSNQTVLTEQANYHKAQRGQVIDEMTAEISQLKAENERLRGEQGQPSLWFVRIPDEPGDPEESPAEYFYTTSVDELNKMLKCPGASVECRYYASPSALKLPIESAFYVAVFALYGFGPDKLCMLDGKDLKRVWNACLDEVRRMNP